MSEKHTPDLDTIAGRATSREELKAMGYLPVAKSADLHGEGYQIVFWIRLGGPGEVLEYMPRDLPGRRWGRPRLTAGSYEEQAAIHRALGLAVVPPGGKWDRRHARQLDLFAGAA